LSDPCEKEATDVTDTLTSQQKEEVTASAQVCLSRQSDSVSYIIIHVKKAVHVMYGMRMTSWLEI